MDILDQILVSKALIGIIVAGAVARIIMELITMAKGNANSDEGSFMKTKEKINNLLQIVIFVGAFFFVFIGIMKKYYKG